MNTEHEQKLTEILGLVKTGKAEIGTISETRGSNSRGHDAVIRGKWKVGGLVFGYKIEEGRKYGIATVEEEGSQVDYDLTGCNGLLRDIVYLLRHPVAKKEKKQQEK